MYVLIILIVVVIIIVIFISSMQESPASNHISSQNISSQGTNNDETKTEDIHIPITHVPSELNPMSEGEKGSEPQKVGAFYDQYTDDFIKVYGNVFQAFRTNDLTDLLDYQIESIGLEDGQKVLDAGCGIGGPAVHFAGKKDIHIDAVTISEVQVQKGKEQANTLKLNDKVHFHHGDYHLLNKKFDHNAYDVIYFLESYGHAENHQKVIESAFDVLKPGGTLYIKDIFRKVPMTEDHAPKIEKEVRKINQAYKYNIPDLYATLDFIRRKGFILSVLKTVDLPLEKFENLSISNEFQELTGVGRIDNWAEYIFPVDFFEIKCFKPWHDATLGNSRYFLQNMYYLQILKKEETDLKYGMETDEHGYKKG